MQDKELLIQLGRNIKAERIKKGITREKLLELLGINSISHITKMENGQLNMSMLKINSVAKAMDVDINKLLDF